MMYNGKMESNKRTWVWRLLPLLSTLFWYASSATAQADLDQEPARLLLDQHSEQQEQERIVLIQRSASEEQLTGLEVQGWREMSAREAVLRALNSNLAIRSGAVGEEIARAALQEAEALFSPRLKVALSYSDTETRTRKVSTTKWKKATTHFDAGDSLTDDDENPLRNAYWLNDDGTINTTVDVGNNIGNQLACDNTPTTGNVTAASPGCDVITFPDSSSPVAYIDYDEPRTAGIHSTTVYGNVVSLDGALSDRGTRSQKDSANAVMEVIQPLPWGSSLSTKLNVTRQQRYYVINADGVKGGFAETGSYGRPWISSLSLGGAAPLPGTRNYGENSLREVKARLARIDLERTQALVQATINDTLLKVESGYWELVGAQSRLLAALEAERFARQMVERGERYYQQREITEYDLAQIRLERARIEQQRKQMWNRFAETSNQLREQLDLQEEDVLLPRGYLQALSAVDSLPVEKSRLQEQEAVLHNHPLYRVAALGLGRARQELIGQENQVRPNLALSVKIDLNQSNSRFGYKGLGESLGNITAPDAVNQNYALNYWRNPGNVVEQATLRERQLDESISQLRLQDVLHTLQLRLKRAAVKQISASRRMASATRAVELTRIALEKAQRAQQLRTIGALELVGKNESNLKARYRLIEAQVAWKKAEAEWLAAQGVLGVAYAEHTAQNDIDKGRLRILQESGLTFFGRPAEVLANARAVKDS